VLDEALVVGRPAASELHLHGGGPVLASVLRWLERAGFREGAQPTGPIPSSWRHVRALLSGRDGPLAALCSEAQAALVTGRMSAGLRDRVAAALALLPFALALRRPPVVRIVGSPNAGKSTLFNALLGTERALVSPTAGTTRDTVRATLSLRGVPVVLEDTAGALPVAIVGPDLVVTVLDRPAANAAPASSLEVLGRADLHSSAHPLRVSGRTGEGLGALRCKVAERLGIPDDPACDLLAPVEAAQRAILTAAFASVPVSDEQTGSPGDRLPMDA
jgi:tRNA modification GTPase